MLTTDGQIIRALNNAVDKLEQIDRTLRRDNLTKVQVTALTILSGLNLGQYDFSSPDRRAYVIGMVHDMAKEFLEHTQVKP